MEIVRISDRLKPNCRICKVTQKPDAGVLRETARTLAESGVALIMQSVQLLIDAGEQESASVVLEGAKWVHGEFERKKAET